MKYEKLAAPEEENASQKIKEKVKRARQIQAARFKNEDKATLVNSEMGISQIKKYCQVDSKSKNLLRAYVDSGKLSARGYHRVLKVARTVADLESSDNIAYDHLAEALTYRIKEA